MFKGVAMFFSRISFCIGALMVSLVFSGCSMMIWQNKDQAPKIEVINPPTPAKIVVSELDIDRPYAILGEVSASVSQTTPFGAKPSKELVNAQLQEEAFKLKADGIIYVRYTKTDSSWKSWGGSMEGKGQAVKFKYY